MQVSVSDPILQTQIFIIIFLAVLLLTLKKRAPFHFNPNLTEEMKGFAMLAIVFSHIGYFLVSDHRFLFPLSVAAGVGVNLFLFLSGFGLTISSINKPLSFKEFSLKRLFRLFIPLWIILIILFILDFLLFGKLYPLWYIGQSFAGIYLTSDPAHDIDSPLWYFTLIFFSYILFLLTFRKKWPFISGLLMLGISWLLLQFKLPLHADNINLYKLHFVSFPLGVMVASVKEKIHLAINNFWRIILLILLSLLVAYFAYYSGVGQGQFKEQAISILCIGLITGSFLLRSFQFRFLNLVGKYSYEIYLIHWPIMFRYQNLYQYVPGFSATWFYLGEFILFAFALQFLVKKLTQITLLKNY